MRASWAQLNITSNAKPREYNPSSSGPQDLPTIRVVRKRRPLTRLWSASASTPWCTVFPTPPSVDADAGAAWRWPALFPIPCEYQKPSSLLDRKGEREIRATGGPPSAAFCQTRTSVMANGASADRLPIRRTMRKIPSLGSPIGDRSTAVGQSLDVYSNCPPRKSTL